MAITQIPMEGNIPISFSQNITNTYIDQFSKINLKIKLDQKTFLTKEINFYKHKDKDKYGNVLFQALSLIIFQQNSKSMQWTVQGNNNDVEVCKIKAEEEFSKQSVQILVKDTQFGVIKLDPLSFYDSSQSPEPKYTVVSMPAIYYKGCCCCCNKTHIYNKQKIQDSNKKTVGKFSEKRQQFSFNASNWYQEVKLNNNDKNVFYFTMAAFLYNFYTIEILRLYP